MTTGIILAGGRGLRFGEDKCLFKLEGRFLIERIIDVYRTIFDEIIISSNNPSIYDFPGVQVVEDAIKNYGPLIGIYSAMRQSSNDLNFVSACDMPFVKPDLINHMIGKAGRYDVVVPSLGEDMIEPLHAIYRKTCLRAMELAIGDGKKRIISFFSSVRVYVMERDEMMHHDQEMLSFFNINTKEDLIEAKCILKSYGEPSGP